METVKIICMFILSIILAFFVIAGILYIDACFSGECRFEYKCRTESCLLLR